MEEAPVTILVALLLVVGQPPGVQSIPGAEAGRFARAWAEKNTGELRGLMAEGGIRLHLPGEEHPRIQPRQAEAALSAFLERYRDGDVETTRVSLAGGDADKGFAEIRWRTASPTLTEPVIFTLFVAFAAVDERWRVTEIRVLF
jgi:hypothetical protein